MTEPSDLPVFVIKAKDALAVLALRGYQRECQEHGLANQAVEVEKAIGEIHEWQRDNIDLIKLPDHAHVPRRE